MTGTRGSYISSGRRGITGEYSGVGVRLEGGYPVNGPG